jgi:hypothetical protein
MSAQCEIIGLHSTYFSSMGFNAIYKQASNDGGGQFNVSASRFEAVRTEEYLANKMCSIFFAPR